MKLKNVSDMQVSIDQGCWHYVMEANEEKDWPDYLANMFLSRWNKHVIPSDKVEEYETKMSDVSFLDDIEDIDDGSTEEKEEGDL